MKLRLYLAVRSKHHVIIVSGPHGSYLDLENWYEEHRPDPGAYVLTEPATLAVLDADLGTSVPFSGSTPISV